MRRRSIALLALVASAALLGGCVSIQGVATSQQDIVGKLRLTLTICASGQDDGDDPDPENEDHPGCLDTGNSGFYAMGSSTQILVGMRLPAGATVPDTLTATPAPAPPAAGAIVLHRDAGYRAVLAAALPPPAGSQWVGYRSDPYQFDDGDDDVPAQSAQLAIDIGLPRAADGGPFVGPIAVRPVVGMRTVSADLPAGRPVDCGPNPFAAFPPLTFSTIPEIVCIDTPTSAQVATSFNFPTRDFGIVAGTATASPGQRVELPYGVRGAGALPAALAATLAASTTLPGASVAPSLPSAPLSNGSNTRVTIPVSIPKDAGPGTFDVSLTGRLSNGQARTGVAKLTVRDRQDPVLSALGVKPKRFRPATRKHPKRGTDVSFSLSEAASVQVVVERCSKRAGKRHKRCVRFKAMKGAFVKAGARGANGFRFNGRVKGKALKPGPYRLALTPTDGAGNVADAAVRKAFAIRR